MFLWASQANALPVSALLQLSLQYVKGCSWRGEGLRVLTFCSILLFNQND